MRNKLSKSVTVGSGNKFIRMYFNYFRFFVKVSELFELRRGHPYRNANRNFDRFNYYNKFYNYWNAQQKNNILAKKKHGKTFTIFLHPKFELIFFGHPNAFVNHSPLIFTIKGIHEFYIFLTPMKEAFNNMGEKKLWKLLFLKACYRYLYLVNISIVCNLYSL